MKYFKILLGLGIFLIFCSTVWADIPNQINFQGILDSAGNPLANKTKSVEFRIYAVPVGGTAYWSETQSVTTNAGGVFNVLLGFSNPIPDSVFDDTVRYLGINVGTDGEMSPRQQIVSNAYGYRVATVDGATGGVISGDVEIQSKLIADTVGIGTTSPGAPISFANTLGNKIFVWNGGLSDQYGMGLQSSLLQIFTGGAASAIVFGHGNSSSFTELMRINGNGNVGIGTTSPASKLELRGNGIITTGPLSTTADLPASTLILGPRPDYNGISNLRFHVNDTSRAAIELNNEPVYAGGLLGFLMYNNGYPSSEPKYQMVIKRNGNVGIGTTSPSEKLHVVGNICATGTIGACSDLRYKTNLKTVSNALEKVLNLKGTYFNWKKDQYPDLNFEDDRQIGFVAQELKEVLPEVVSQGTDGFYSVDYGKLTPLLVEAIKDQQKTIQSLEDKLEKLEKKLDHLTRQTSGSEELGYREEE